MSNASIDIGEALKMAREAADLTQQEMAEAVGIPLTTLRNIEQGRSRPRTLTARAVLDAISRLENNHAPDADHHISGVRGAHSGE